MPRKHNTCTFEGCERRTKSDLCAAHRHQRSRGGPLRPIKVYSPRTRVHRPAVPCKAPDCERPQLVKGYCGGHYAAHREGRPIKLLRNAPLHLRARALIANASPDECWEWLGSRDAAGYGQIMKKRKGYKAHRVVYEMAGGYIAPGLVLDHLCRNRGCVNPAHLEAVTGRVNVLRGFGSPAINARKTHCKRGHTFDEENTYAAPSGSRECRACNRDKKRRWRQQRSDRAAPLVMNTGLAPTAGEPDMTQKPTPCERPLPPFIVGVSVLGRCMIPPPGLSPEQLAEHLRAAGGVFGVDLVPAVAAGGAA